MSDRELPLAHKITEALIKSLGDAIWATELAFCQGARRCDLWTISANSSAGFKARAYEVKISRADFRRDNAVKQREARLFSDQFYYVTPAGLLRKDEVPDWAGLIEWDGERFVTVIQAPYRDKDGPTWELVVSLIRNSGNVNRDTDLLKIRVRTAEQKIARASKAIEERGIKAWEIGL
ncbi:hypothetical protein [Sphingomonas parapaucimobilis]|uniref:hypothetical protein n=1 Tax=Sphingomonas parapaucimobilis TaxID=28213 RepID=UPI00321AA3D1